MATIKDIARVAGVAQGTVSNVLNNTGKVSAEKIRRVNEAIAQLGYVPNVQASLLRQGSPKSVVIILPTLEESAYLDFYLAAQFTIQSAGYESRICTTDDAESIELAILQKVRISDVVAVLTVSTLSDRCCDMYRNFPCPVAYIERKPAQMRPNDIFCGFDTSEIVQDWVLTISQSDWKRVALFFSPRHFLYTAETVKAFEDIAQAKNIDLFWCPSDIPLALSNAFELVQMSPAFDAIICFGSEYTSSIETAIAICKVHPQKIFSIRSTSAYQSGNYDPYEVDCRNLGIAAANAVLSYASSGIVPHDSIILKPKGFPYNFSDISKNEPTSISLFTLDNPSTNALQKLLPMFENLSGIKVELVSVTYEALHAQLDSLSQCSPYDIIRIDMADFSQLGDKLFMPLSDVIPSHRFSKQFPEDIYKQYSLINGVAFALPFDPSAMVLLYRQDLFSDSLLQRAYYEENKEKLEVPTTIDQYVRISRFFSRSVNPNSPTEYGSTTTCGSDATFASDFLSFYLGSGNSNTAKPKLYPLNSPHIIEAMVKYKELQQYTCKRQWWRDSLRQFASGNTAMTIVYSNYVSDVINAQYSNIVGQVGTAVLPGKHPLIGGGVIGVSRFSKSKEACRQFLNWLYSDDVMSLIVRLGGTSPSVDSYDNIYYFNSHPWHAAKKESIACGTRGADGESIPGFSIRRYERAIGTAVQKLVLDSLPPEKAAAIAQDLYDNF